MKKIIFKVIESERNKKDNEIIKQVYTMLKDNKNMSSIFNKLDIDSVELFNILENKGLLILDKNLTDKRLKLVRKIIYIAKCSVSEDITLMYDDTYDRLLNTYKQYKSEDIVERMPNVLANKRTVDVEHKFGNLKGTIDKAHCFYLKDEDKTVSLERVIDKWFKCLPKGESLKVRITLKFDGVSIVLDINKGKVKQALTRGEDGKGADLTDLFKHLKFSKDFTGGLKCECVITDDNIDELSEKRKRKYVSRRSAVVGALSGSDAYKTANCLTLIPLQVESEDRYKYDIDDLCDPHYPNKANYFLARTSSMLITYLQGLVGVILDERDTIPYDIDGIVIDVLNEEVIEQMGRKDDINRYQIAYKFPPKVHYTKVTYIDFTVGRTGLIVPMVHYEPIEFNGGIHTKSTLSSFKRFKELDLHENEVIKVTYNNDVMPYVHKSDKPQPNTLGSTLTFPDKCVCGSKFVVDGANLRCVNPECTGSVSNAYYHFYKVMGITDFAEKSVEALIDLDLIKSYKDLLELDYNTIISNVEGFKHKKTHRIVSQLEKVKSEPIIFSKLLSALGICGNTTANEIMSKCTIEEIINTPEIIYQRDMELLGDISKNNFLTKLKPKLDVIRYFNEKYTLVNESKTNFKTKVTFTGFRDKELENTLNLMGIEVVNFKKSIDALIVVSKDTDNDKVKKAIKNNIPIYTRDEYIQSLRADL